MEKGKIMTKSEVLEELGKMIKSYSFQGRSRRDSARNKYADDPNSYSADLDINLAEDYETAVEWLEKVSQEIKWDYDDSETFVIKESSDGWVKKWIHVYGSGYLIDTVEAPLY